MSPGTISHTNRRGSSATHRAGDADERAAHPGHSAQQMNLVWPVAETDTHWIVIGLGPERLCAVQRRGELPRDPGGGHRARCPRADT
jgi:hypothetical protein